MTWDGLDASGFARMASNAWINPVVDRPLKLAAMVDVARSGAVELMKDY
jgi:hypothetical protein